MSSKEAFLNMKSSGSILRRDGDAFRRGGHWDKVIQSWIFSVVFVGDMKESTYMVVVCWKTFCGSPDLTLKVAVLKLKNCLRSINKFEEEMENEEMMNNMCLVCYRVAENTTVGRRKGW